MPDTPSPNSLVIRPATLADIPELVDIEAACFPLDAWGHELIAPELNRASASFRVAEAGQRVLGFALGWSLMGEMEVLRVAVLPTAQRRGLGRRLLADLEAQDPTATLFFLEVREDNTPAIALYTQAGYREVGIRLRYYSDGMTALVLRKTLE